MHFRGRRTFVYMVDVFCRRHCGSIVWQSTPAYLLSRVRQGIQRFCVCLSFAPGKMPVRRQVPRPLAATDMRPAEAGSQSLLGNIHKTEHVLAHIGVDYSSFWTSRLGADLRILGHPCGQAWCVRCLLCMERPRECREGLAGSP